MTTTLHDPIVLDPPDFDLDQAWKSCIDYVEQCGGMQHPDGEPNMRAAAGADPGICSCPRCRTQTWAFGLRQRCPKCSFEFPTRWLSMFRWGQAASRNPLQHMHHLERLNDEYYALGFENPDADHPDKVGKR